MATKFDDKLVIGISSRALFKLEDSNKIFEEQGIDAYSEYQIKHENTPLEPGVSYKMVEKLLNLKHPTNGEPLVEVILLSRNSADTGLRIFNSIQHYGLNITRAAFTNGESPYQYISAFGTHLFLSANPTDVSNAIASNCAAATILPSQSSNADNQQLRIAFDGDAVLFSDHSEQIFQQHGLDAFNANETLEANTPLQEGPFKGFLLALHTIQKQFESDDCPIRTALVTARNAPAHERVIRTLRSWGIRIDEALFLGGMEKGQFLQAFAADIFFDDQTGHCNSARQHVATGHVPIGVLNPDG